MPLLPLIIFLILPSFLTGFQTELIAKFLVFAIVGISYDLIWGFAGISNFGHAVFFGLGAYGFGLTLKYVHIPGATYLAFAAAILLPLAFGIFLSVFLHHGKVAGAFLRLLPCAYASRLRALPAHGPTSPAA